MMILRDQLLHVATLYAQATKGRSPGTSASLTSVSTRVFNDGKTLLRLTQGGDLSTGNFEKAVRWFSANWPEGVAWPEGIDRPQPREGEAA